MVRMNRSLIRYHVAALWLLGLAACSPDDVPSPELAEVAPGPSATPRTVFVQLFEWSWPDIARECEVFLGPAGYAAVQVSPPQEHIPGPEWWTRYQPVSYLLESRGGTREEFADMVRRCDAAGVAIYGDAIINHMSMVGTGTGVAGSGYSEYDYPVPYGYDDFHHCGRNGNDHIQNYQDLWEVQNCELSGLADLDTGDAAVQARIAAYLNDMLSLGVAGFRIDAAKHIAATDITEILQLLDSDALIYQEVIDRGGEPIDAHDYLGNGRVSEFKYPMVLFDAFANGQLDVLAGFASRPGFLPAEKAIVFVDNHDIQRGHAGASEVLNYKSGERYELANVFMLAWPYGYPMVMSSYRFEDGDQGPPDSRPIAGNGECDAAWVCEHRRPAIAGMVGFRNATAGTDVSDWQAPTDVTIAFGRDDRGVVVINLGTGSFFGTLHTSMDPGTYCDVVSGCQADNVRVEADGTVTVSLPPMSAVAIHRNSLLEP